MTGILFIGALHHVAKYIPQRIIRRISVGPKQLTGTKASGEFHAQRCRTRPRKAAPDRHGGAPRRRRTRDRPAGPETLKEIGASSGDVLEIEGRTRTVAKAMPTFKEQRGQQVIQLDGVGRTNAGVAIGQKVAIAKVVHAVARSLVLTPLGGGALHDDEIEHTARRLDGLAVRTGDRVRIALFGGSHRDFSVVRTEPDGPVMIHPDTLLSVDTAARGRDRARTRSPQTTSSPTTSLAAWSGKSPRSAR